MSSKNINNDSDTENEIILFLIKCNIICKDFDSLNGIIIQRDSLLSHQLYDSIKNDLSKLKIVMKSSIYTSMQKNAANNQKWPLLNLIRQLLRRYNYDLLPKRVSDGYTKDGKKKYKRFFEIKKQVNNDNN